MCGGAFVVARQDFQLDSEPLQAGDRFGGVGLRRVGEDEEAEQLELLLVCVAVALFDLDRPFGEGQDAVAVSEQIGERLLDLVLSVLEWFAAVETYGRATREYFFGCALAQ